MRRNHTRGLPGVMMAVMLIGAMLASITVNSIAAPKDDSNLPQLDGATTTSSYTYQAVVCFVDGILTEEQVDLIESAGGDVLRQTDATRTVLVQIEPDSYSSFAQDIQQSDLVDYVERNHQALLCSIPSDPYYPVQWNLSEIEAHKAWPLETGSANVVVAVVDTGVAYDHPDLDGNYVGGYDFGDNDADPYPDLTWWMNQPGDGAYDHGTRVAGIIAAETDNGIGVAGIAQVQIFAAKVSSALCPGSISDFAIHDAIVGATHMGADIINLSLASAPSYSLHAAIQYAYANDVLLVGAAGNDGEMVPTYPAAYPEVMAVGATAMGGKRARYSNYGDWIDVSAPGGDEVKVWGGGHMAGGQPWEVATDKKILSTTVGDYGYAKGTSMSAAHVSGVAALIKSKCPEYSAREVRKVIENTCDDLGHLGKDMWFGYGRVNAYKAISLYACQPSYEEQVEPIVYEDPVTNVKLHVDNINNPQYVRVTAPRNMVRGYYDGDYNSDLLKCTVEEAMILDHPEGNEGLHCIRIECTAFRADHSVIMGYFEILPGVDRCEGSIYDSLEGTINIDDPVGFEPQELPYPIQKQWWQAKIL